MLLLKIKGQTACRACKSRLAEFTVPFDQYRVPVCFKCLNSLIMLKPQVIAAFFTKSIEESQGFLNSFSSVLRIVNDQFTQISPENNKQNANSGMNIIDISMENAAEKEKV